MSAGRPPGGPPPRRPTGALPRRPTAAPPPRPTGALPRRALLAGGAALSLPLLGGFRSLAESRAPKPDPWPVWDAHDPAGGAEPDYAALDALLARRLRLDDAGVARFDYDGADADDRAALAETTAALAAFPVSERSRPVQFAFWCNLYNALTLEVMLDHWPVASIRDIDISPGLFSSGPWGKALAEVEGRALTLNDIEHRVLRPGWDDPRAHYAVNCASVGCPNLKAEAWRAATLEADLDAAARAFANNPRAARLDSEGRLVVSKIYAWFLEDFGGDEAGVLAHLSALAEPPLAQALESAGAIHATAYDWSANAA